MPSARACAVALLFGIVALSGCASGSLLDASREDLIPVQAGALPVQDVQTRIIPTDERGEPVSLVGVDGDGNTIDAARFRGAPLVINAWASWCAPCLEEAPILTEAATSEGVSAGFLGLRVMDDVNEPPPALAALPFDHIIDADGTLLASIPGVPPRALPSTTVLDAQGRISAQRIGPLTSKILKDMIAAASQP